MFERSYTPSTLRRYIRKSDFQHRRWIRDNKALAKFLADTALRANATTNFSIPLSTSSKRGKVAYTVSNFSDELLLRKASAEINWLRKEPVFSREIVVASLRSLLEDAVPHRIYRFDIRSFFESIDSDLLVRSLERELSSSPVTMRIIRTLLESSHALGGTGVPRGVGLSQSLAEFSLSEFDRYFLREDDFFFYGRYVDDIVLVAETKVERREVVKKVLSKLPSGMRLNPKSTKRAVVYSPRAQKRNQLSQANIRLTNQFSYLGYKFKISNVGLSSLGAEKKNCFRRVSLDIADEKIKKIKTRLVLAARDFLKSSDFDILLERVKFLSSNYSLPEKTKRHKRLGGIFYNYSMVDSEASDGLLKLDDFLRALILSGKGSVFSELNSRLSADQKRKLLTYSFKAGFESKRILHFSPKRVRKIVSCWQGG